MYFPCYNGDGKTAEIPLFVREKQPKTYTEMYCYGVIVSRILQ